MFTPTATLTAATATLTYDNQNVCITFTGTKSGEEMFTKIISKRLQVKAVSGTCAENGFKYLWQCNKTPGG